MERRTRLAMATLAVLVGSLSPRTPLRAQITEVARTPIADAAQITFGYLCDDRFVIRNDGTKPIDLEYGLEKGTEHTRLALGARESVELQSKAKSAMELWMDGKLIAKAVKERRSCKDVQGNASVTVNPLEVATNKPQRASAYGMPYPFYDPWGFSYYGYAGWGWRPYYYTPAISYPIIIGGRGRGGRRR